MGGSPSRTRRLTLDNEESASVIKVSEDVVQRLKSTEKKPGVSTIVNPVSPGATTWPAVPGGAPLSVPPQPYFYEPSLTSLQIRQEREAALKKNDQYWEKRVLDLEKVHGQMHQIMESEYQKAMEEQADHPTDGPKCKVPPCQIRKRAVMECYKKNPREPMKCCKEVEEFAECVDVQRATLISNRS